MSPKPVPHIEAAYLQTFNSEHAATVLGDLVLFAESAPDPAVRCGRLDMIARILRKRGNGIPVASPIYEEQVEAETE